MSVLSREAIFAVLSGLSVLACDKSGQVTPTAEQPAASAGKTSLTSPGSSASPAAVGAKEVPSGSAADAKAGAEKSCAPGGCAPGSCGGNKKK
jgi:hypothetical protein